MPVELLFALLSFLLSLSFGNQEWKQYRFRGFAQGTTYSILYFATDSLVTQRQTDSTLQSLDSSLSIYKPYSLISRFNAGTGPLRIDRHLKAVVQKSCKVYRKTSGAFDATVLPLVQAWGFGTQKTPALPDSATIRSLLRCVGTPHIKLRGNQLIKKLPCVQLDVNGIAQGYSVDVLATLLESRGIHNYLIELGGEIRVKGRKQPSNEPMTIGIEGPSEGDDWNEPVQRFLQLREGAVTTSGNYRRFYQSGSKTITHLIDPRTGYPAQNELISVTVWAKDAITADGYDNALMVMGLEKALHFLKKQKHLEAYFIYRKPDSSVTDTATPGFAQLLLP